jgi:hypothetical protein
MELRNPMVVRGPRPGQPASVDGDGGPVATARTAETPRRSLGNAGPSGDRPTSPIWYEIADDHSVLELSAEATSGHSLALHVVIDTDADTTIAWWETENGMWVTEVGAA